MVIVTWQVQARRALFVKNRKVRPPGADELGFGGGLLRTCRQWQTRHPPDQPQHGQTQQSGGAKERGVAESVYKLPGKPRNKFGQQDHHGTEVFIALEE